MKFNAQNCSGFPAVPTMNPCSAASNTLTTSNPNISSGVSYSYCGTSSQSATFSGLALNGGAIYICGNATMSIGSSNSGTIFVACGATLTLSSSTTLNQNIGIVNYGTVIINGSLTFQNSGNYFYNEGPTCKLNINGDWNFPGNTTAAYVRNAGKINVTGTMNLSAGGKICASPGSVISIGNLTYGGSNCNSSDKPNYNLLFNGSSSQETIFRYSGTASIKGIVTNSNSYKIYCAGSTATFPCGAGSSWGTTSLVTSSIPALPAEPSQNGCLVNGNVSCNSVVVLPVELIYFEPSCINGKVRLDWATGSERNNEYWSIERSTDLVNIQRIGEIDGAGNSTHLLNYTFEDPHPLGQVAYYRIKQHDYDGKSEAFDWVSIDCGLSGEFNLFPNPSSGTVRITTTKTLSESSDYQIVDSKGKVIFSGNADLSPGNPIDFNMEGLNAGVYFLKIQSGDESWTSKLVKI